MFIIFLYNNCTWSTVIYGKGLEYSIFIKRSTTLGIGLFIHRTPIGVRPIQRVEANRSPRWLIHRSIVGRSKYFFRDFRRKFGSWSQTSQIRSTRIWIARSIRSGSSCYGCHRYWSDSRISTVVAYQGKESIVNHPIKTNSRWSKSWWWAKSFNKISINRPRVLGWKDAVEITTPFVIVTQLS